MCENLQKMIAVDYFIFFEMVKYKFVAQLAEQSLPTPEVCSSNPVIENLLTVNCIEKI